MIYFICHSSHSEPSGEHFIHWVAFTLGGKNCKDKVFPQKLQISDLNDFWALQGKEEEILEQGRHVLISGRIGNSSFASSGLYRYHYFYSMIFIPKVIICVLSSSRNSLKKQTTPGACYSVTLWPRVHAAHSHPFFYPNEWSNCLFFLLAIIHAVKMGSIIHPFHIYFFIFWSLFFPSVYFVPDARMQRRLCLSGRVPERKWQSWQGVAWSRWEAAAKSYQSRVFQTETQQVPTSDRAHLHWGEERTAVMIELRARAGTWNSFYLNEEHSAPKIAPIVDPPRFSFQCQPICPR